MNVQTLRYASQNASDFIALDSYHQESKLIYTQAHGDILMVGRVYEMSPLAGGGTEFNDVIHNIAKTASDNSVIQVSLLCYPDHDAPNTYLRNKTHGGELIQELVHRKANLLKESSEIGWQPDMPVINVRKVIISTQTPVPSTDEKRAELDKAREDQLFNNIKTSGFHDAKILSIEELLSVYRHYFNFFKPRPKPSYVDPVMELKYQVFSTEDTMDFRDPKTGQCGENTYISCVTAKAFPREPFHGLMNLLSGAPFNTGTAIEGGGQRILTPYILNTTIQIANQRNELRRIEDAIRSREATQNFYIRLGNEDPVEKLNDLKLIKKQASIEGNKIVYTSTHIFLFGKTRTQAIQSATHVKGIFDRLDFDARDVTGNILPRFTQILPMNYSIKLTEKKIKGRATMTAAAAGYLLPIFGDFLGNVPAVNEKVANTGSVYVTRRAQAHYFDPFISDSHFSGLIAAEPGAGKSFLLQDFITSQLAMGRHVYLLDNGRSSKKFCITVGGEYNEFGGEDGYAPSLNPFSGLTPDEFNFQRDGITSLLMLMAYEAEAPAEGAKIALSEAVNAAFNSKTDNAEVYDVIESLKTIVDSNRDNTRPNVVVRAANDLVPRLNAFISNPNRSKYFTGKTTIDPKKQFTVFELGALGDDLHLKKCVLFFVLNTLLNRTRKIDGKKLILADEAHDLIDDETASHAFEGLYLKGRKDGASIWLIIQSLLKLSQLPAGATILNQSAWKLILQQPAEEIDRVLKDELISAFKADPYFAKQIKSVRSQKGIYSEIQIIGRNTYEVVRLYVDKWTATLYGSEGEAREGIFKLMESGMTPIEAVNYLLNDKTSIYSKWIQKFLNQLKENYQMTDHEIQKAINKHLKVTNE